MATMIPHTTTGYWLGMDRDRAANKLGTVVQDPTGQWWEVTEIKARRTSPLSVDFIGYGKKVSAKYAALSQQIESLKNDWLAAKDESTFGPAAWDFNAGAPARAKMAEIKAQLDSLDAARVAKVMPRVEIK